MLSLFLFSIGLFLLFSSQTDITASVVGVSAVSPTVSSLVGIISILASMAIFASAGGLEEIVDEMHRWKAEQKVQ